MKKIGKFWEVADFKDFVTNGKGWIWGIFRRFLAKNALFLVVFHKAIFDAYALNPSVEIPYRSESGQRHQKRVIILINYHSFLLSFYEMKSRMELLGTINSFSDYFCIKNRYASRKPDSKGALLLICILLFSFFHNLHKPFLQRVYAFSPSDV